MRIRTNIRAGVARCGGTTAPRCGGRCAPTPRCGGVSQYDYLY